MDDRVTQAEEMARLMTLRTAGIPLLIGAVGVFNATGLMDVGLFLRATHTANSNVLGWLWSSNSGYQNALRIDEGLRNDVDSGGEV